MQRVLYIDFDGTLCTELYWRSLPEPEQSALQRFLFGEDRSIVYDWMRGRYTAEAVNQLVAEHIGIGHEQLWEVFVRDCQSMQVQKDLLDVLQILRERYTTVLITDNMDSFSRFTAPALQLDTYFDHLSNSYFEKLCKADNQGEIFTRWSSKLEVPLAESTLIDNSKTNCSVFENLGGQSILVNSPTDTLHQLQQL